MKAEILVDSGEGHLITTSCDDTPILEVLGGEEFVFICDDNLEVLGG